MEDYDVRCKGCDSPRKRSETYHMADNSFRCESCLQAEIGKREAEVRAMKAWRPWAKVTS